MVALNSYFATSKPDTDAKNRVGRFFSLVAESVGEDSCSSRKYAGEKRGCGYDFASVDTEFEYGPFGELIRATGEKKDAFSFRFSTKYEDIETRLLYYGYRYYNAETGRWLNRDPIGEVGGLNLYGMVGNDCINGWDLLGLTGDCCPDICKGFQIVMPQLEAKLDEAYAKLSSRIQYNERLRNSLSDPTFTINDFLGFAEGTSIAIFGTNNIASFAINTHEFAMTIVDDPIKAAGHLVLGQYAGHQLMTPRNMRSAITGKAGIYGAVGVVAIEAYSNFGPGIYDYFHEQKIIKDNIHGSLGKIYKNDIDPIVNTIKMLTKAYEEANCDSLCDF